MIHRILDGYKNLAAFLVPLLVVLGVVLFVFMEPKKEKVEVLKPLTKLSTPIEARRHFHLGTVGKGNAWSNRKLNLFDLPINMLCYIYANDKVPSKRYLAIYCTEDYAEPKNIKPTPALGT